VDDARTRSPELDAILLGSTLQEVKNLLVGENGTLEDVALCARGDYRNCTHFEIRFGTINCLNEMVAMNASWNGTLG